MTQPLPPYSGDNPTCAKCSNSGARTTHRAQGVPGPGQVGVASMFPERLDRECDRCDYRWSEALNPPAHDGQLEQTARIFAGLHRSAEAEVTRVIDLYERWVKAGPPPLGTSVSRWWDARLAELYDAIRPPAHDQEPSA